MRNRPALALLTVLAAAGVAFLFAGLTDRRADAFSLGVQAGGVAAELRPGDRACQERIDASESFSEVEFQVGTFRRAGAPLEVVVHAVFEGGERLGGGTLAAGYPDVSRQRVAVGDVSGGRQIAVCIEATGGPKVALYGNAGRVAPSSTLRVKGEQVDADLTLVFLASSERSLIAEFPEMLSRAALFKGGWVGQWTLWLLALAVVVAVPGSLLLAVRNLRGHVEG